MTQKFDEKLEKIWSNLITEAENRNLFQLIENDNLKVDYKQKRILLKILKNLLKPRRFVQHVLIYGYLRNNQKNLGIKNPLGFFFSSVILTIFITLDFITKIKKYINFDIINLKIIYFEFFKFRNGR